jgi:hypothetical protein
VFEQRFAESRRLGVEWTVAQKESEWVPGSEARSLFSFTEMKDGKPTGNIVGAWYVFVKTEDGTWKYSDVASKRWVAYLREQEKQPPANSGD